MVKGEARKQSGGEKDVLCAVEEGSGGTLPTDPGAGHARLSLQTLLARKRSWPWARTQFP